MQLLLLLLAVANVYIAPSQGNSAVRQKRADTGANTVTVACDNEYSFYMEGNLVANVGGWAGEKYDVPPVRDGQTFAIYGLNHSPGPYGILVATDNGFVTNALAWRCTNDLTEADWSNSDFDDSHWPMATSIGANGIGPWGKNAKFPDNAEWIWTDNGDDLEVRCRGTVKTSRDMCTAWGNHHTIVYDGDVIHFQGTCCLVMSQSKANSGLDFFKVVVRNERRPDKKQTVAYTQYAEVYIDNPLGGYHRIKLDQNSVAYVNDFQVQPGFEMADLFSISKKGQKIQMDTTFGVTVMFDGDAEAVVKVPSAYRDQVEGICGNNNLQNDDFQTKEGLDVSNDANRYSLIGESWRVPCSDAKVDDVCPVETADVAGTCTLPKWNEDRYCGAIKDENGPFKQCIAQIMKTYPDGDERIQRYFDSCVYDVCAEQPDEMNMQQAACGAKKAFDTLCWQLGVTNTNWRGWECPQDKCIAEGDPHYHVYDGQRIDFQGVCCVLLSQSIPASGLEQFRVIARNERIYDPNGKVSNTQYVETYLTNEFGKEYRIRFDQKAVALVDGVPESPGFEVPGLFAISKKHRFIRLDSMFGLTVEFDGDARATVMVPFEYRNQVEGICGNNNQVKDDFQTKEGLDVSGDANKNSLIGESWRVPCHASDPTDTCPIETQDVLGTCAFPQGGKDADGYCGTLKDPTGTFQQCIEEFLRVYPNDGNDRLQGFFDSCVYDACALNPDEIMMQEAACSAREGLNHVCGQMGIDGIDWRADDCPTEEEATQRMVAKFMKRPGQVCSGPTATSTSQNTLKDCSTNCYQDAQCVMFVYNDKTGQCDTYDESCVLISLDANSDTIVYDKRPLDPNVKLVGGQYKHEGRLNYRNLDTGLWGTVCDSSWNLGNWPTAFCREAGYTRAADGYHCQGTALEDTSGPVSLVQVSCGAGTYPIDTCQNAGAPCGHEADVCLVCETCRLNELPTITKATQLVKGTTFQELVDFTCEAGYQYSDGSTVQSVKCDWDEKWTAPTFTECIRLSTACNSSPCQNGGVCSSRWEADANGDEVDVYTCMCKAGFAGTNCELSCGTADVVYIVDASGSIGKDNWPPIMQFLKDLTNAFDVSQQNVRIGGIRYSTTSEMLWTLKDCDSQKCVTDKLDNMAYSAGATNTSGALWQTWKEGLNPNNGARSNAKDICILFTDGRSNKDAGLTIPYGKELQDRGCSTFVVAIGEEKDINEAEIDAIASKPLSTFKLWQKDRNFDQLVNFIPQIVTQACLESQKSDVCRSSPCQRGGACTTVDANKGTFKCQCPDPYTSQPDCAGLPCDQIDMCFVVDGSSSVTEALWPQVREFLKGVTNEVDFRSEAVRMGIVTFSTSSKLEVDVRTYTDRQSMKNFIDTIAFPRGGTETMRGIETALKACLNGQRSQAKKKIFVITDGAYRTSGDADMAEQLTKCKDQDVEVFSIGFGNAVNVAQLYRMATTPNNVIMAADLLALVPMAVDVMKSMCGPRPCLNSPCQNGGKCRYNAGDPGGYNGVTCQCPNKFITGDRCQSTDYCSASPCRNGGVCQEGTDGPVCQCTAGWAGRLCDKIPCGPADLCFLIDGSLSVNATTWSLMKTFLRRMVDELNVTPDDVRIGLTEFSTSATSAVPLGGYSNKNDLKTKIAFLAQSKGGTETGMGLKKLNEECFAQPRPGVRKLAVIVVDGYSPRGALLDEQVKALIDNKKVETCAIGYGSSMKFASVQQQIKAMANNMPNRYMMYPSALDLIRNANLIAKTFCADTDYCSSSPCMNGGFCRSQSDGYVCECPNNLPQPHCVDHCSSSPCLNGGVCRPQANGYVCDCPNNLLQPNCIDPCKPNPCNGAPCERVGDTFNCLCPGELIKQNNDCVCPAVDVCFVVDTSFSVRKDIEFPYVKNFVRMVFTKAFPDGVRMGVGTFSTQGKIDFTVGGYTNRIDGIIRISKMQYVGGGGETNRGLQTIREQCFTTGREGAKKMGVIITDGDYRLPSVLSTEATKTKNGGIEMIAIGFNAASKQQLLTIANLNTNHAFTKSSVYDLNDSFAQQIANLFCDKGQGNGIN